MPSAPQLDVKDVSKHFGGLRANDRISLSIGKGEIVGLIGPNGSGKTTLFNSIVGHHRVDAGFVRFENKDITHLPGQKLARLGILRTFQQTRTYHGMTSLENVEISLPPRYLELKRLALPLPSDATNRALELLDFFELADKRHIRAGELSFGQRRLLELAMVFMNEPKLLLLDEPTAGINPVIIEILMDRLRRSSRDFGITLVVIEHNMPVIMGLAERIYCLNRGRVLSEGTPKQIQRDSRVIDAYLGAR